MPRTGHKAKTVVQLQKGRVRTEKRFLRVRCMVTRRVFLCPLGRILLVGTARRENEERSHRKRDKRTRKRIRIWSWFPEAAIWLLSKEVPRNSLELRSRLGMMPTCMSCALPRGRVSLTSVLRTICWNVSAWSKTHQVVLTFLYNRRSNLRARISKNTKYFRKRRKCLNK